MYYVFYRTISRRNCCRSGPHNRQETQKASAKHGAVSPMAHSSKGDFFFFIIPVISDDLETVDE